MAKKIISKEAIAKFAVGQAKALKEGSNQLEEVKLDTAANIIAYTVDNVLNENVFNLYIAEKKIK